MVHPYSFMPWSSFSPISEFVECGDSSPHGYESGDKSPHSTLGGLNEDQVLRLKPNIPNLCQFQLEPCYHLIGCKRQGTIQLDHWLVSLVNINPLHFRVYQPT